MTLPKLSQQIYTGRYVISLALLIQALFVRLQTAVVLLMLLQTNKYGCLSQDLQLQILQIRTQHFNHGMHLPVSHAV